MKNILKFLAVLTVGLMIFLALYLLNNTGINKISVEMNARAHENIATDWNVCKDTSDEISSLLFYDNNLKNHNFSIYVKRKGFSFGFFNRASGSLGPIMDNIVDFRIKGYDSRILMSMNKNLASKVTIDTGSTIETIEIDNTKPFTLILPVNGSTVTIYDINDKILEPIVNQL